MPTISDSIAPKPKGWQEFESICRDAFEIRWPNAPTKLSLYGTAGSSQNGVDIFGTDNAGRQAGIQCKQTVRNITQAIVDREIEKAERFDPPLQVYYIATTADAKPKLQSYVSKLNNERLKVGKFGVQIVFWTDLWNDLRRDRAVLAMHWPEHYAPPLPHLKSPDIERSRDIALLEDLFLRENVVKESAELGWAPKYLCTSFLDLLTALESEVIDLPGFRFYDRELGKRVRAWISSWQEIRDLSQISPYRLLGDGRLSFYLPMDRAEPEHQPLWESMEEAVNDYVEAFREMVAYLEENYDHDVHLRTLCRKVDERKKAEAERHRAAEERGRSGFSS